MRKKDHRDDTIQISVESGKLKYKYESDGSNADSHESDRDHYVKWCCEDGNYTIVFGEHTPFAHPSYSRKKGHVLSIPVNSDPETKGTYKYSVIVEQRANKHITDDPEVVIN